MMLIVAWAWRSRQPEYVWFSTQPLDTAGHRAKVMYPRGWEVQMHRYHLLNGIIQGDGRLTVVFTQHQNIVWSWFRGLLRRPAPDAPTEYLDIGLSLTNIGYDPGFATNSSVAVDPPSPWMGSVWIAERVVTPGKQQLVVLSAVTCSDKQRFDELYPIICNSVQIESVQSK